MAQTASKAPSSKANNTLLWVVILIIAILIGAVVVYLLATKSPSKSEAAQISYQISFPASLSTDINNSASTCDYQATPLQIPSGQGSCTFVSNNILAPGDTVNQIDIVQQPILPVGASFTVSFSTDGTAFTAYNGSIMSFPGGPTQLFYKLDLSTTSTSPTINNWGFGYTTGGGTITRPVMLKSDMCGTTLSEGSYFMDSDIQCLAAPAFTFSGNSSLDGRDYSMSIASEMQGGSTIAYRATNGASFIVENVRILANNGQYGLEALRSRVDLLVPANITLQFSEIKGVKLARSTDLKAYNNLFENHGVSNPDSSSVDTCLDPLHGGNKYGPQVPPAEIPSPDSCDDLDQNGTYDDTEAHHFSQRFKVFGQKFETSSLVKTKIKKKTKGTTTAEDGLSLNFGLDCNKINGLLGSWQGRPCDPSDNIDVTFGMDPTASMTIDDQELEMVNTSLSDDQSEFGSTLALGALSFAQDPTNTISSTVLAAQPSQNSVMILESLHKKTPTPGRHPFNLPASAANLLNQSAVQDKLELSALGGGAIDCYDENGTKTSISNSTGNLENCTLLQFLDARGNNKLNLTSMTGLEPTQLTPDTAVVGGIADRVTGEAPTQSAPSPVPAGTGHLTENAQNVAEKTHEFNFSGNQSFSGLGYLPAINIGVDGVRETALDVRVLSSGKIEVKPNAAKFRPVTKELKDDPTKLAEVFRVYTLEKPTDDILINGKSFMTEGNFTITDVSDATVSGLTNTATASINNTTIETLGHSGGKNCLPYREVLGGIGDRGYWAASCAGYHLPGVSLAGFGGTTVTNNTMQGVFNLSATNMASPFKDLVKQKDNVEEIAAGLAFTDSDNTTVTGNHITEAKYGIKTYKSGKTKIEGNVLNLDDPLKLRTRASNDAKEIYRNQVMVSNRLTDDLVGTRAPNPDELADHNAASLPSLGILTACGLTQSTGDGRDGTTQDPNAEKDFWGNEWIWFWPRVLPAFSADSGCGPTLLRNNVITLEGGVGVATLTDNGNSSDLVCGNLLPATDPLCASGSGSDDALVILANNTVGGDGNVRLDKPDQTTATAHTSMPPTAHGSDICAFVKTANIEEINPRVTLPLLSTTVNVQGTQIKKLLDLPVVAVTGNTCGNGTDPDGSINVSGTANIRVLKNTVKIPNYNGINGQCARGGKLKKILVGDQGTLPDPNGQTCVNSLLIQDNNIVNPGAFSQTCVAGHFEEEHSGDGSGINCSAVDAGIMLHTDAGPNGSLSSQNQENYVVKNNRLPVGTVVLDASSFFGDSVVDVANYMNNHTNMAVLNNKDAAGTPVQFSSANELLDAGVKTAFDAVESQVYPGTIHAECKVDDHATGTDGPCSEGTPVMVFDYACADQYDKHHIDQVVANCPILRQGTFPAPISETEDKDKHDDDEHHDAGKLKSQVDIKVPFGQDFAVVSSYQDAQGNTFFSKQKKVKALSEQKPVRKAKIKFKNEGGGFETESIEGSELFIETPLSVYWDGTTASLPISYDSAQTWEVQACVTPPEGYAVAGQDCQSVTVPGAPAATDFTLNEVGSVPADTQVAFKLTHKGKTVESKTSVGVRMSQALAAKKGVKVDAQGFPEGQGPKELARAEQKLAQVTANDTASQDQTKQQVTTPTNTDQGNVADNNAQSTGASSTRNTTLIIIAIVIVILLVIIGVALYLGSRKGRGPGAAE